MLRGGLSLGTIYLIIGVIVAAANDYFDNLETTRRIGEAIVAVVVWPFVIFGYDVSLR